MHPLDNPVWHALSGPHRALAQGDGHARRYPPPISIFGALPDAPTAADWEALAALVGGGNIATLFRDRVEEPAGWERTFDVDVRQMVATSVEGRIDADAVDLGPEDAAEMVALVAATEPGPFGPRTVELGGYVGVRDDEGRLVAMAGHRLALGDAVEVSAVCTAESHRGRGLAERLVRHVVARAEAAGRGVFLHASARNVGAIRLYERMGFTHRRAVVAAALVAPGDAVAAGPTGSVDLEACADS